MSPALKVEVSYQSCKHWIRRLHYLKNVSKLFLQDVTSHMKNRHFAQGECFGDNFELYIVKTGLVSWSKGEGRVILLRSGSVWGDEHLFLNAPELLPPNTSTTMTFTEVLSIDRTTFKAVCQDYPEYHGLFHRIYIQYAFIRTVLYVVKIEKKKKNWAFNKTVALGQIDPTSEDADDIQHHNVQARKARRSLEALRKSDELHMSFGQFSRQNTQTSQTISRQNTVNTRQGESSPRSVLDVEDSSGSHSDDASMAPSRPRVAASSSATLSPAVVKRLTDLPNRLIELDERLSSEIRGVKAQTQRVETLILKRFELLEESLGIDRNKLATKSVSEFVC
eukprot:gnl/MRDRNA2_/MRDRNA2_84781_c0_seq1.p1 gnl/MRDRNA2_/MRDRNA2_84781_c0~~gnl/MRDRNA2_/MRDRNA2_84781_c0_seq1.p1  ORF type:complete len:382 (+),score=53.71 gnl/MRDRNA2_/MRDRNA2_84781_c0_seq1:141-1148(+)